MSGMGPGGMPGSPDGADRSMGGMPPGINPDSLMQLMQSPLMQQTMQSLSQNPQMLRAMMESNPMLRPMMVSKDQHSTS